MLIPELSEDDAFRERFVRESRMAASINHPNIIPIYDAGDADGLLYIVMRYVEGADLKALLRREGPLPVTRACVLISQVGGALHAAHETGLIHRDIKPGNILIERIDDGIQVLEHVYLADFGLTKHAQSRSGLTHTGQFVGTVDYVAPEQIEGRASRQARRRVLARLRAVRVPDRGGSLSSRRATSRCCGRTSRNHVRQLARCGRTSPRVWTRSWSGRWRSPPTTGTRRQPSSWRTSVA